MEREHEDDLPLIDGLPSLPPEGFEAPCPAEGFQNALFAHTAGVIRSRSRWKHARVAAALIAVYIAGFGTSQLLRVKTVEAPTAMTIEPSIVLHSPVPADRVTAADPAAVLHQVRTALPAERPRLLKQAGDEYLTSSGDLEVALHCYRQFLEIASDDERMKSEPGDTWLLASLKQGQTKTRMR